jgi:hypothetical protein
MLIIKGKIYKKDKYFLINDKGKRNEIIRTKIR